MLKLSTKCWISAFNAQGSRGIIIAVQVGAVKIYAATVNQHPPVHHPLDACYDSVMDDPQLSYYPISSW